MKQLNVKEGTVPNPTASAPFSRQRESQAPGSRLPPISTLDYHLERISERVGRARVLTVQHPAEMRAFKGFPASELRAEAGRHNLRVVSRMDGLQLEFTRLARG